MLNFTAPALFPASEATESWTLTMAGPGGQMVDGACTERELRFLVRRNQPQGGVMTCQMQGLIEGDPAKGTATMESTSLDWTAKRK